MRTMDAASNVVHVHTAKIPGPHLTATQERMSQKGAKSSLEKKMARFATTTVIVKANPGEGGMNPYFAAEKIDARIAEEVEMIEVAGREIVGVSISNFFDDQARLFGMTATIGHRSTTAATANDALPE
jgi:hypothetical protein